MNTINKTVEARSSSGSFLNDMGNALARRPNTVEPDSELARPAARARRLSECSDEQLAKLDNARDQISCHASGRNFPV
jgi:hypothetical protein